MYSICSPSINLGLDQTLTRVLVNIFLVLVTSLSLPVVNAIKHFCQKFRQSSFRQNLEGSQKSHNQLAGFFHLKASYIGHVPYFEFVFSLFKYLEEVLRL